MKHQSREKQQQKQKLNICQIVEKSSPLFERLQGKFIPEASQDNEEISTKNLEKWCQKIAQGDWQLFQKRLDLDGLKIEQVKQFLGSVRLKNQQDLPDWTKILTEVVHLMPDISKSQIESGLAKCKGIKNQDKKYAFEELLYPFITVARDQLIAKAGSNCELLSSQAIACLELDLLKELSNLASNTLYLEFSLLRSRQTSSVQRLFQELSPSNETKVYQMFVGKMLAGDLVSFLEEYAVLSRLIASTIELWVEVNAEFFNRLAVDLPTIKSTFFDQREIGQVVDLQLSLSEPHNGRRAIIILTFDSGEQLVYKPKDLGIDRAYFQLLEWFNQQEVLLPFKSPTLLERPGYGWVEYVKSLPCLNREEVRRFYQRAGILLGLMYILQGADLFYENIIACGEYPIPIDLEALMHNNFKIEQNYPASQPLRPIDIVWRSSVFRTGLLPTIAVSADQKMSYDIGGLREAGQQVLPFMCSAWRGVNSDGMKREREFMKVDVYKSVPRLGDSYLTASDYTDEIVFGFQQMYRFVLERKSEFLAKNGPLEQFQGKKIRHILRNTRFYTSVLRSLLEPAYLRDGVQRSIEIDILSRMYLNTGKQALYWTLLKCETEALEQMDIPFFTLRTDSTALDLPNGEMLTGFCEKSSLDNVISQINSLKEQDLTTQVRLSESILRLSAISGKHTNTDNSNIEDSKKELEIEAGEILSPSELIAAAKAIADEIKTLAIYTNDGSASWIAPQLQGDRYILQPLRLDLYQGVAGLLVFLAALQRVTGDESYRQLIQGAALPLKKAIATMPMSTLVKNGYSLGGYTGIGSLIYGFTRLAEFLDEPIWLEDATFAASLISPDWIALDKNLDILGGAAGAILSLLSLYQKTQAATLLETAFCCGEHLLASRTKNNQGVKGWHKIDSNFITGLAHGAAGIAYGLLRLYEFTEDKRFKDAAWEAISYEQSVFDEIAGNWPDFRPPMATNNQKKFMTAWCHGAPGIGLARIGGLSIFRSDRIEKEIDAALQTTRQFSRQGKDHLCCGNFGRIEILLVASQHKSQAELAQVATQQASWVIRRAQQQGSYNLFAKFLPGIFHPAFFQGTSGIGYQLLRLAYPDLLPSVLLLN